MQNISQGMNQSNQPLYGQAQQAQFLNNLNSLANSSINSLQGQMARMGGGNSGALEQGANAIGLNKMSQFGNYLANVPLMNRQAQLQSAQTYGGLGNSLMSVAPRTQFSSQTGNQFSQGTGTNQTTQKYDPSVMSDIGQTIAIAAGAMGMPSSGMVSTPPPMSPAGQQMSGGVPGGVDPYMSYNQPGYQQPGIMAPPQVGPGSQFGYQPLTDPGLDSNNPYLMWNQV